VWYPDWSILSVQPSPHEELNRKVTLTGLPLPLGFESSGYHRVGGCSMGFNSGISVADPGYLSRIPDLNFFPSQIHIKEFKYFNPTNCFSSLRNLIRVVHPGSGSWFFTHPGSRIQGQKDTGSRILVRNTVRNVAPLSRSNHKLG
jgi:hypothetical protein